MEDEGVLALFKEIVKKVEDFGKKVDEPDFFGAMEAIYTNAIALKLAAAIDRKNARNRKHETEIARIYLDAIADLIKKGLRSRLDFALENNFKMEEEEKVVVGVVDSLL